MNDPVHVADGNQSDADQSENRQHFETVAKLEKRRERFIVFEPEGVLLSLFLRARSVLLYSPVRNNGSGKCCWLLKRMGHLNLVRFGSQIPKGVDLGGLYEEDLGFFCSANELRLKSSAAEDMDNVRFFGSIKPEIQ